MIDQAEAVVVRRIFSEYLSGASQRSIAIGLNDDGVPTLTGTRWYATTVAGMLRNPLYKGWVTHNGESFQAVGPDGQPTLEPIIDTDTWDRARELRDSLGEAPGKGRGRRTRGSHLFTNGLLRCTCGAPMSPVTKPTRTPGQLYEVYACARRLHHGIDACPQPPIKRAGTDTAVFSYFENVALDTGQARQTVVALIERNSPRGFRAFAGSGYPSATTSTPPSRCRRRLAMHVRVGNLNQFRCYRAPPPLTLLLRNPRQTPSPPPNHSSDWASIGAGAGERC